MTAVYQPIPNTNYLVSNTGEVVRTDNKPVSARPSKNGAYYTLKIGNKWSSYRAAKLVLFAFRQIPLSEQTRIKYRDNNPLNAALDNLNTDFVVENPNAILAASRVFKFDESGELVATYHSAYAASKANDIAYSVISQVARSGQFWRGAFYRYSDQFDKADLAQVAARRHVRLVRSTTANTLYQYDLAGNYVQSFHTPADVQVALNKSDISHIYKVMRGVRANAFGFIWSRKRHSNVIRYKEQQYDIVKRNATTGEIVDRAFGYAEAAKKFGKSLSGIYNCVSLQQADHQNFRYEKQLLHKI